MTDEKRFAVLIDSENVSAKYIKYILDEISNYGTATYKRIYGDWTKPTQSSWKDVLLENSITPVQQYVYTMGKNATDSAMIIDAMDILYSGNVEGYCIVSSDSDFTKLSSRLRESGMMVVGMGEKKTPKPFIAACNQFKYLDILAEAEKKSIEIEKRKAAGTSVPNSGRKPEANGKGPLLPENREGTPGQAIEAEAGNGVKPARNTGMQESGEPVKYMTDIDVIKTAVIKMLNESDAEDQSMHMGEIGSRLVKRYPDFDVRNYGDTKLSKFLRKFDLLEIRTRGKDGKNMWVSLKPEKPEPAQSTPKSSAPPQRRGRRPGRKK